MNTISIDEIKKRDDDLFSRAIVAKDHLKKYLLRRKGRNELFDEINDLIATIEAASETVDFVSDYQWLSDAALRWHTVFSTALEAPRIIRLNPPKHTWLPEPSSNMTEEEIESYVDGHTRFTCYAQKAKWNNYDTESAYQSAKTFFVSEVLDGRINFVSRISPASFWRLEEKWVFEIKQLRAYFIWSNTDSIFDESETHKDFDLATESLRNKLICKEIKARLSEFKDAKNYIQTNYLREDGKLKEIHANALEQLIRDEASRIYEITGYADEVKNWQLAENHIKHCCLGSRWNKACKLRDFHKFRTHVIEERAYSISQLTGYTNAEKNYRLAESYINDCLSDRHAKIAGSLDNLKLTWLVRDKAHRIFETTGSNDMQHNWILAENYVRMFYENIIPAVEQADKEKILRVLKTFQYSKVNKYLIKNCFELSLAIYFLDAEAIIDLWNKSSKDPLPDTNVESFILLDRPWPEEFAINEPCKERFILSNNRHEIDFKGVMLPIEMKALIHALNKAAYGNPDKEHIDAIERLYKQSRLIHKETTL